MPFAPNASTVFADGPLAAPQRPDKAEIRRLFAQYEAAIDAFSSGAGSIAKATKALLLADLAHDADVMAWVYNDTTVSNNGIYKKTGVTGAGSWTLILPLPYSFIVASNAGAGTANAIHATTPVPVSTSAIILLNVTATNTASPVTVQLNGGTTYVVKTNSGNDIAAGGLVANMLLLGVISGGTFRLISDQLSAAIIAQAEAAANRAEAARDAALGAVPNAFPSARAALAALNTSTVTSAYLKEAGRQGQFDLQLTSSLSLSMQAMVSADSLQAVSVISTHNPNYVWIRSGAWRTTGILCSWFGFTSDAANPINASTTEGTGPYTVNPNGPFQKAFDFCVDYGFTFIVDQKYYISNYLMLKSGARMRFTGAGQLVCAVSDPVVGGLITGRYNLDLLGTTAVTDVTVWGLNIDLNAKPAMNGLAVTNFTVGRFHGATCIANSLYDATYKGGRAVQFEGSTCDDIHIDDLYITNCSIGVNSQALPTGSTAKHISYGKVAMKTVGMPFNIDCTDAGSSTMLPNRMSTTVGTAVLNNCGRPSWLASGERYKAGIVTGDRGSGLYIGHLRVVNDDSYGLVGGLFKGTMYGVTVVKASIYGQFNCLADFNYLDFISGASTASNPSWVEANVSYAGGISAMPRILDTKSGGGSLGSFSIRVKANPASVTSICGVNASTYTDGRITLVDAVSGTEYPQMSARQAYNFGNTFSLLTQPTKLARSRQDMTSATPRTILTVSVPNDGRAVLKLVLATFGTSNTTAAAAKVEEFYIAICRDGGGALTSAVTAGYSAQALDGYSSLTHALAVADAGSGLVNINATETNNLGNVLMTTAVAEVIAATAGASIIPSTPQVY